MGATHATWVTINVCYQIQQKNRFDKARSNQSREVPRKWYRVGCGKRGLSNTIKGEINKSSES